MPGISKTICAASFLLLTATAQAGLTSLAAGYAVGKISGAPAQSSQPMLITSDTHDVIACESYSLNRGQCSYCAGHEPCRPAVFAGQAGYKAMHKTSVHINGSSMWIIMEVSK